MNFVWRQRVSVARKSYMHGIFLAFLLHLWSFLGDEVVLQRVLVSTNQETARCSPPANLGDHGEAPWLNGMSAFHRFAERLGRREIDATGRQVETRMIAETKSSETKSTPLVILSY